jgi:c-di-GMP-binding flagellar brake protein YcgR
MNAPGPDPWADFRITHGPDCLHLLQALRDGVVPVVLNLPDGTALPTTLWTVDAAAQRLGFSADTDAAGLGRLVEGNEATAVAYLENVKLQFELHGFVLVHGASGSALHSQLPRELYRFQRRNAFRVRSSGRPDPTATFRHPAMPDMSLALRMLDVSIGGCALWLPGDVPPLQAGTRLGELQVALDAETHFSAPATLQHITSLGHGADASERAAAGVRIGCEWLGLPGPAERTLQRWIDRAQQRQRLLAQR